MRRRKSAKPPSIKADDLPPLPSFGPFVVFIGKKYYYRQDEDGFDMEGDIDWVENYVFCIKRYAQDQDYDIDGEAQAIQARLKDDSITVWGVMIEDLNSMSHVGHLLR